MGCELLNEHVGNAILQFLENKGGPIIERDLHASDPKARYSPATLINEWYEDRQQTLPNEPDLPLITEYNDNYRDLCRHAMPDRKEYFKMMFDSQGLGNELLIDHLGKSFNNNFTTTYDLCYNHLVKGLCGPFPRKYRKGKYVPETDLTLIYGNLTQWGIKEKLKHAPQTSCRSAVAEAEYRSEYVPYDMAEVKKLNDFPFMGRKKTDLKN